MIFNKDFDELEDRFWYLRANLRVFCYVLKSLYKSICGLKLTEFVDILVCYQVFNELALFFREQEPAWFLFMT